MRSHPPREEARTRPRLSPLARALGWVILAVAALGLAAHAVLYLASREAAGAYARSDGIWVAAGVACANILANWVHYRRTRMPLDIASRIVTYLWLLSVALMLRAGFMNG